MWKNALVSGIFLYLVIPSTSAVSLRDFQQLTVDVSATCSIAYDRTIPSCTTSDFSNGATCSTACVSGLNQIASGVLDGCGSVVVGSSTLLGRIFSGAIISSLCPNNGKSTGAVPMQSSTAAPQASTVQSSTQAAPAKATTIDASTAAPSSSSASATSSSSSSAVQSSSSTATVASTTTAAAAISSSSSTSSSTSAKQTSTSQSQTSSGNSRSGMTVPQQQIAVVSQGGGGSPFDIVGYSSANRLSSQGLRVSSMVMVLVWSGILLGR